jgi:L-threonylcarbamoyladenylate synthase
MPKPLDYRAHPRVRLAALELARGGVVAYPTEGVWGLGAHPFNRHAVEKILGLKNRPVDKGLILVAAHINQLDFILRHLSAEQRAALAASWPGPNTWLVPHHGEVPPWISGQHETVALRVSAHPVVRALAELAGPLVSTSANPQGLAPARQAFRARGYFGNQVFYAPGQVFPNAGPSTIRDLLTGRIVRA